MKVTTYPARDWCGLICVYFHADKSEQQPLGDNDLCAGTDADACTSGSGAGYGHGYDIDVEFDLPEFVEQRIAGWQPLSNWDIGNVKLLPTDWVDQAGI